MDFNMKNLKENDEVYWNDPDNGICSGIYTIIHIEPINESSGGVVVYHLMNKEGSETQAHEWELEKISKFV